LRLLVIDHGNLPGSKQSGDRFYPSLIART
jgi:hypothetical protein